MMYFLLVSYEFEKSSHGWKKNPWKKIHEDFNLSLKYLYVWHLDYVTYIYYTAHSVCKRLCCGLYTELRHCKTSESVMFPISNT